MTTRLFPALLSAMALLSMAACNNSGDSSSNTDDTSKSTPSNNTTAPTSSIVTTPESMLVVKHKVSNFSKWKMAYDAHDSARTAAGIHSYVIGRGVQDSNMVLVAMRVDDTTKAMAFKNDPGLKAAMQKGGVVGTPDISLVTMIYQDTARLSNPLRSAATFTVKDWDAWVSNFQTSAQERTDNGIAVRSYGHDAGDNHKVRVVTALVDSAKATAYFKSDMLKKRMQSSGASSLDRFIFRVVQRY